MYILLSTNCCAGQLTTVEQMGYAETLVSSKYLLVRRGDVYIKSSTIAMSEIFVFTGEG